MNSKLLVQQQKMHVSQSFYSELEELSVDHFWQIADAGDQEFRRLARSSRRDIFELGAEDNVGIASYSDGCKNLFPVQQSGIHCLIVCAIQLLTPNNSGIT